MDFSFRRIRDRTIVTVCAASLFPLVLLGFFVFLRARAELLHQALIGQKALAGAIRQGLMGQISLLGKQLFRFSEEPSVQNLRNPNLRQVLEQFLDWNPFFFSCYVYDEYGTVVNLAYRNRYRGNNRLIGKNLLKSKNPENRGSIETFKRALKSGSILVADRVVTHHQQTELFILAPVRDFTDASKVIGILSCGVRIDGSSIQEVLADFTIGADGFMVLTDGQGSVIGAKGHTIPFGLEKVFISKIPSNDAFESTETTLLGRPYIVTIGKIPTINGMVLIGSPRDVVLGFISQILIGFGILTVIGLIIATLLSIMLSNNLSEPVLRLVEGIRKVSDGIISHRVEIEGKDELAEAGRAFNEMASKLEKNRLLEEIWSNKWKPPV